VEHPCPFAPFRHPSARSTAPALLYSNPGLAPGIVLYCTVTSAYKDSWLLSRKWRFIASRRAIDQKLAIDIAVLFNICTYTISKSLYHFIGCTRSKFINFVVHLIQICLVLTDHFCSRNCLVTHGRFLNINKSLRNPNTNRQTTK
jgi:hypothetical protein